MEPNAKFGLKRAARLFLPFSESGGNYCFRLSVQGKIALWASPKPWKSAVHRMHPARAQAPGLCRAMPTSSTIHVLQLLRELLAFVLLSYTVLIGALLLAGWTTYFLVLK